MLRMSTMTFNKVMFFAKIEICISIIVQYVFLFIFAGMSVANLINNVTTVASDIESKIVDDNNNDVKNNDNVVKCKKYVVH